MSEQQLTRDIIDVINETKLAFVWRSQSGKVKVRGGYVQLAPDGCPDVIGWMLYGPKRGYFVGIEVKLPKGKPTPVQTNWLLRMNECRCIAITATNVHAAAHAVMQAASW